jgi:hypothetical protein
MEKLTTEELQKLQSLQDKGQALISELGQIEVAKISLEIRREKAKQTLAELQQEEIDYGKQMSEKYGPISVNPETGEITKVEA